MATVEAGLAFAWLPEHLVRGSLQRGIIRRLPLVAGASVAVILVSLIGVAAMTGLLPSSKSANSPQQVAAMEQADQPGQAAQG
ncbi:hypothetical protein ABTJ99_19340, partial [Acinetobacter baumannii]